MNDHGRMLLLYGESYPRQLITASLAWILLAHQHEQAADQALGFVSSAPGNSKQAVLPPQGSPPWDVPLEFGAALSGESAPRHLYLIDGANTFDAYGLVRFIARQGQDPSVVLRRIHVSRAFTCYQLAERVATLIPSPPTPSPHRGAGESEVRRVGGGAPHSPETSYPLPAKRGGAGVGQEPSPLYLLGLLDTFYDENVPLREVLRLLDQILAQLRQRARDTLVIIVTKLPPVKMAERAVLVRRVQEQADASYRIEMRNTEG